jgi:transposase
MPLTDEEGTVPSQTERIAPVWKRRALFIEITGTSVWPGNIPDGCSGNDRHIIIAWHRFARRPFMPWREVSVMEQRREFVWLARQEGVNRRELCRRFGIHPDTGYKWLGRGTSDEGLADRSRRPHQSPLRTAAALEQRIVAVRDAHPAWGARKIARCLEREGVESPAVSTVHEILRRHGRIGEPPGGPAAHGALRSRRPICFGRWTSRAI